MSNQDLFEFFANMYAKFGQFAVIDFVKSRQDNGQLSQARWQDCDGCDWYSPFIESNCLICGGK